MDALYASFLRPAISPSTSAPMSAIGFPPSAGSARGSLRWSRSPARRGSSGCIHGRDPDVTLLPAACGDMEGTITLKINCANPTVSTASAAFVDAAGRRRLGGAGLGPEITVPCLTLDSLIRDHGRPAFIKIDVEGFEAASWQGSRGRCRRSRSSSPRSRARSPRPASTGSRLLGPYRFNVALGESQQLVFDRRLDAGEMAEYLDCCRTKPIPAMSTRCVFDNRIHQPGRGSSVSAPANALEPFPFRWTRLSSLDLTHFRR